MTFPFAKVGLLYIEPFTFAFYRFVISSVALLIIVRFKNYTISIDRSDFWKIIGLGVLIIPFNQTLYLVGQSMTGVGHGSLLFATVPIWIFLGAVIHLNEKMVLRRGIGIVIALVGVAIVMAGGGIRLGSEYLVGDLIILVAVLAWVYYTIFGKPLVRKYGALRVTAYALVSGSVLYLPFGSYRAIAFDYSGVPAQAWIAVLYVAIGTSVVAYILWYWVLKYLEASRIAVFHNIQPIFATLTAYWLLNEPVGWSFLLGGAVALTGVIIAEV